MLAAPNGISLGERARVRGGHREENRNAHSPPIPSPLGGEGQGEGGTAAMTDRGSIMMRDARPEMRDARVAGGRTTQ